MSLIIGWLDESGATFVTRGGDVARSGDVVAGFVGNCAEAWLELTRAGGLDDGCARRVKDAARSIGGGEGVVAGAEGLLLVSGGDVTRAIWPFAAAGTEAAAGYAACFALAGVP